MTEKRITLEEFLKEGNTKLKKEFGPHQNMFPHLSNSSFEKMLFKIRPRLKKEYQVCSLLGEGFQPYYFSLDEVEIFFKLYKDKTVNDIFALGGHNFSGYLRDDDIMNRVAKKIVEQYDLEIDWGGCIGVNSYARFMSKEYPRINEDIIKSIENIKEAQKKLKCIIIKKVQDKKTYERKQDLEKNSAADAILQKSLY